MTSDPTERQNPRTRTLLQNSLAASLDFYSRLPGARRIDEQLINGSHRLHALRMLERDTGETTRINGSGAYDQESSGDEEGSREQTDNSDESEESEEGESEEEQSEEEESEEEDSSDE
jgi:hypothetical protein